MLSEYMINELLNYNLIDLNQTFVFTIYKQLSFKSTISNMNTPKYGINPARSVSPLRSTTGKPKYYQAEDVNKIVRNAFQPKIQFLMHQLQEKQQIIAKLNNKLNENDEKLIAQTNLIQSFMKKQKQLPQMHSYMIANINQLINDKMKQNWESILSKFKQISQKVEQKFDSRRLQGIIYSQMQKLKDYVNKFIDSYKEKSDNNWKKIKEALSTINKKIARNQNSLMDIAAKLQNFQTSRMKEKQIINELQSSKNVVKNLVQLKKSVGNMFENYQAILSLQKGLKQKIEDNNIFSSWTDHDSFKPSWHKKMSNQEIALEYSKEEGELKSGLGQNFDQFIEHQNNTRPIVSPTKVNYDKSISIQMLHQKTTPLGKSNGDHSDMFSLNTSNNPINSRIQNNTLLINLSLQTRKQMCQGVKERLITMIQTKNLVKPLEIRYDQQINYLKTAEGNYLFDLKGNMFKTTLQQLKKLEEEGLVIRQQSKKMSLSASKVKRTNC